MRGLKAKLIRQHAKHLEPDNKGFYRYLKRSYKLIPRDKRGS